MFTSSELLSSLWRAALWLIIRATVFRHPAGKALCAGLADAGLASELCWNLRQQRLRKGDGRIIAPAGAIDILRPQIQATIGLPAERTHQRIRQ